MQNKSIFFINDKKSNFLSDKSYETSSIFLNLAKIKLKIIYAKSRIPILCKVIRVLNPFKHSRSFVADFLCAEKVLQHGVYTMHNNPIIRPSPRVIIHQLDKTEGGLTDIEERVLRELAISAGAREVVIYLGCKINTNVESFDTVKVRVSST